MINFEAELEHILTNDPLGLLNSKPKAVALTSDDRLVASFEEINQFIEENGREPELNSDIMERRLFSRLKGLRESPAKALALAGKDRHGLLSEVELPRDLNEIQSVDDILSDDVLGIIEDSNGNDPESIFTLKHVTKSPKMPDHVARRKPCPEFDKFEPLFKQVQADLASSAKVTEPFVGESQIKQGEFFVLQGMLVYVANIGNWEKRSFGNKNARLYCVFENGTESNMLLRSLAAALWTTENSRHVINADQLELNSYSDEIGPDDEATGYIYVLRSLSDEPRIRSIKNLYKIGFSSQPALERIKNANTKPTYLMADVKLVAEFRTVNLNPQKFELLLHTFFANSCLELDVSDSAGVRHRPREWFVAPYEVIEKAIRLLETGEIVDYVFDHEKQRVVPKDNQETEELE